MIQRALEAQRAELSHVARLFADAIADGGVVHVYANGHSRIAVEELCVRMGALTGFHPLLQVGLTSFTDVVGVNGLRGNQAIEKVEGLGAKILDEYVIGPNEPLMVVTATGTTPAAVDIARDWIRRYPRNPLVALCSREQAQRSKPKHSSGETMWHVVERAEIGILLDNGMPVGDTSVVVDGKTGKYAICPVSSVSALSFVQSLNELTLRELDRRGVRHHVLGNMHLGETQDNYDAWLSDQRRRYARALAGPHFAGDTR